MTEVFFTRIPITGIPELKCNVRMDDLGRVLDHNGDVLPMDRRPNECGYDGLWLLGRQSLCERHFRETCQIMEIDPDEVEAEVRSMR